MSLYTDASLIMFPSGYKKDKIYSLKPTDGSGDLTFTRASTATRVNEQGLIEGVRTNLLTYSEQFDNAAWSKNFSTITANSITSPDGTSNADKLVEDTSTSLHFVESVNIGGVGIKPFSIYVKAAELSKVAIRDAFTTGAYVSFDLSSGTIISEFLSVGSISPAANGFYRISIVQSSYTANSRFQIFLLPNSYVSGNILGTYLGNGINGIYLWGAQAEISASPTEYIPTTSTAVSVGMLANVPRIDYTGGGCGSLLLEPQRTNLLTYSEQFENAAWNKNAVSITANSTTSPDGRTNADLITANGTTTQHYILQSQASSAKTISFFVKMGTQRYVQILTSGSANSLANYDLQTGDVGGLGSASTASMVDYGNSWWRIVLTSSDALAGNVYLCFVNSLVQGRFPSTTTTGTIWIWGAMAENGATYPTSYIPTLASSVTRLADAASKTGISSLIGQTEGTIFFNGKINSNDVTIARNITLSDGTSANRIILSFGANASNGPQAELISGGVGQASGLGLSMDMTTEFKFAFAYATNNFRLYVNGILIGSDLSGVTYSGTTLNRLSFANFANSSNFLDGKVQSLMIFPSALSDTELATLTTL